MRANQHFVYRQATENDLGMSVGPVLLISHYREPDRKLFLKSEIVVAKRIVEVKSMKDIPCKRHLGGHTMCHLLIERRKPSVCGIAIEVSICKR